jgi:hypothetical protein
MVFITGFLLCLVAGGLGYTILNWQWWAFVFSGSAYIFNYKKLENLFNKDF